MGTFTKLLKLNRISFNPITNTMVKRRTAGRRRKSTVSRRRSRKRSPAKRRRRKKSTTGRRRRTRRLSWMTSLKRRGSTGRKRKMKSLTTWRKGGGRTAFQIKRNKLSEYYEGVDKRGNPMLCRYDNHPGKF